MDCVFLKATLSRLASDHRGNVIMMAALVAVPLMTVAGFAVDYQLVTTKKTQVQFALDSAVIAGARELQAGRSETEITQRIQSYIDALAASNGNNLSCLPASVSFGQGTQDITADVDCSQPTTISVTFGINHLDFHVSSTSTYGIGKLDVAFVFDSSGSMAGSKLDSLKSAATLAIAELIPDGSNSNGDVRIAMTAYNHMVNAGTYFPDVVESTTYTAVQGGFYSTSSTYQGQPCVFAFNHWYYGPVYTCGGTTSQQPLPHTCVFEREGSAAFTAHKPEADKWLVPGGQYDDTCPPSTPLPLTADKTAMQDYIDNLSANGGTAGHQGVAWGWYMIAPEWSAIWPTASTPLAYDEPDSAKAMILMTDGAFNSFNANGQGSSSDQARTLCDNAKAAGVIIYSVAFQAPQSGQDVLSYCASGPEFFFDPTTGQQLQDSYRAIAASISDLRIKS